MRRWRLLLPATVAVGVAIVALIASGDRGTRRVARSSHRGPVPAVRARPTPRQRPHPQAGERPDATVTVPADPTAVAVPASFLGISTEYWAMPMFERHTALFERVLTLLRVQGIGQFVLRIGGDSTDHALFDVNVRHVPRGVFELIPAWFQHTSVLVRDVSARVIIDLNLVTDLPQMAALWARAAQTQLPPGSIVAYEIGNEPDRYDPSYWSQILSPLEPVLHTRPLAVEPSADTYIGLYLRYARVLRRFAPGAPLAAPVLAYARQHIDWIANLLAGPHPGLGLVTAHEYPTRRARSSCLPAGRRSDGSSASTPPPASRTC